MISEALKNITENFEKGFNSSTLIGWKRNFDEHGRPLNANPNYRDGSATIEGKTYWFTRKGWKVRIWDRKSRYTDFMSDKQDFIEEVDLDEAIEYIEKNGYTLDGDFKGDNIAEDLDLEELVSNFLSADFNKRDLILKSSR